MLKSSNMIVLAVLAGLVAGPALAGSAFRLEIGAPIAAGSDSKVKSGDVKLKNAVLVVRPLACDDAASVRVTGTAEGIVNGARRSVPLTVVPLATPGVHAVGRQWPDGHWVLTLTATCPGRTATASVVVPLTATSFAREKIRFFQAAAPAAQVDASLNEVVRANTGTS